MVLSGFNGLWLAFSSSCLEVKVRLSRTEEPRSGDTHGGNRHGLGIGRDRFDSHPGRGFRLPFPSFGSPRVQPVQNIFVEAQPHSSSHAGYASLHGVFDPALLFPLTTASLFAERCNWGFSSTSQAMFHHLPSCPSSARRRTRDIGSPLPPTETMGNAPKSAKKDRERFRKQRE
jgi:hypothetical protein